MKEARVFLSPAAAQTNQVDDGRADLFGGGGEGRIVTSRAIGVRSGRRIGLMQLEPLLSLPVGVIEKLVIDLARSERIAQFLLDDPRVLRGVDCDGER